jgi:hypothetical protein
MSKNKESACYCQYKRFEILKRGIASPSDVCWGKETENILRGFWQLPELFGVLLACGINAKGRLTDAQYGSSAGMILSSESRNMPFLNTSFESEAPIMNCACHLLLCLCADLEMPLTLSDWHSRLGSNHHVSMDMKGRTPPQFT